MPELERFRTSGSTALIEAAAGVADPDEWKWVRLGGSEVDLATYKRDKAIKAAEELFMSSLLAARYVETTTDFIVGESLHLTSPDPEAARVLREFWTSPLNRLNRLVRPMVQELLVYGELAIAASVRKADGFVATTFIPSSQIKDITEKEGLPGIPERVILKSGETFQVIDWDPSEQAYVGDCFLMRIRRLAGQTRGYPLLLPLIDWIRIWEEFCYAWLERSAHYGAIWWEVELQGFTQEQVDEWLRSRRAQPPRPGTVFAHNERVKWELVTPKLQAREAAEEIALFHQILLASAGLADPETATYGRRPTRERGEILDTVIRSLSTKQAEIRAFFADMGRFALQEAMKVGRIPYKDYEVECRAPRLGVRDIQRSSGALSRITDSLATAVERRWLAPEEAAKIYRELLSRLGFIETPLAPAKPGEG